MLINTHGDVNLVTTAVYHSGGPRTHRGHPKCLQMCRAEMEGNKTKSKKTKGERENIEDEEETQKVSHKKERGRRKRRLKRLATCKSALAKHWKYKQGEAPKNKICTSSSSSSSF